LAEKRYQEFYDEKLKDNISDLNQINYNIDIDTESTDIDSNLNLSNSKIYSSNDKIKKDKISNYPRI